MSSAPFALFSLSLFYVTFLLPETPHCAPVPPGVLVAPLTAPNCAQMQPACPHGP